MLFFRDAIFASAEKIDLIQSLSLAQLHDFAPQVSKMRGRHPMLHSGFGVTRTIHVWHPGYVFDPKTVDDDVGVNVAAMIVTVRMRDHDCLMARKVIPAELQTEGLRPIHGQSVVGCVRIIRILNTSVWIVVSSAKQYSH